MHRLIQRKEALGIYFPLDAPGERKHNVKNHPEAAARKPADVSCAGSAVTARQDAQAAEAVSRESAGSNHQRGR